MRAIINGTRYDTDRATLLAQVNNLHSGASGSGDFNYWEAGLYRTPRSGRYFIAGAGGPMSHFGTRVGTIDWSGGERIIPLDDAAAALAWAEGAMSGRTVYTTGKIAEEFLNREDMATQPDRLYAVDGADVIEHLFSDLITAKSLRGALAQDR